MAALTAAAFTVSVTDQVVIGRKRLVMGTLTLTQPGSDTTPADGVPLPAIGKFGMKQRLDALVFFGNNGLAADYMLRYDKANHKLLFYVSHDTAGVTTLPLDTDAGEAPATRIYDFLAFGW